MVDSQANSPANDSCIIFDNAAVKRGGKIIWENGNFAIPRGSVTAIVGTNGTGKTTMLFVELGLLPLATGHVTVLGKPAGEANSRIGYVPQSYNSVGDANITVEQSVLLGLTGTKFGFHITTRQEKQSVQETLEFVGLKEQSRKRLSDLSGGQRQRTAIAQALVSKPELLLLDEPLANLDLPSQSSLVELLTQLNREMNMTIQVVSHDLNMLLPILTGAIYLLDGHPHYSEMDSVMNSELLTHLYGTSIEVITTPQGDMFVTHNSAVEPPNRTLHDTHDVSEVAAFHTHTPSDCIDTPQAESNQTASENTSSRTSEE